MSLVSKSRSLEKEQEWEDASPFPSPHEPATLPLNSAACIARPAAVALRNTVVDRKEPRKQMDKNMIEKYFPINVYGNLVSDPLNEGQKECHVVPLHLLAFPTNNVLTE